MRTDRRLLAVLALGAVVWTMVLVSVLGGEANGPIDLRVYRTGGEAWLRGLALYEPQFPYELPGPRLPFTYPPIAAVLFAGLALLPWWLALGVVVGAGIAALATVCWLAAARLTGDRRHVALLAAVALGVAPLLEPVHETLSFGQINLLLAGLIAADCLLRRTPWPRGTLIGVAAAVKLTPAVFALFFVARRQWRPVLVSVAAFLAVGLIGLLAAPADTREYWFGVLLDPARIGGLEFTSNQSLRGLLHRLDLPAAVESAAWLGLAAVVGVLALTGVAALRRRGDELAALVVTAAAALLVSPVSWSHHWVWAVPGLLWLADRARRAPTAVNIALLTGALAAFVAAPQWWLPHYEGRELDWNPAQQLLGNVYVSIALAVVVAAAVTAVRGRSGTGVGAQVAGDEAAARTAGDWTAGDQSPGGRGDDPDGGRSAASPSAVEPATR